jgi:small subunit ribosomal protein S16
MVRIRLRRVGARNQPSYRIVVADQRKPRDGRFLEILGHYNPRTEPATVNVDEARLFYWLKNGAQASDSVRRLLDTYGTWDRWERYQAGEDLRALLQETEANVLEVDPRTRRDDLAGKRPKRAQEVAFSAQELLEREAAEAPAGERRRRQSRRRRPPKRWQRPRRGRRTPSKRRASKRPTRSWKQRSRGRQSPQNSRWSFI